MILLILFLTLFSFLTNILFSRKLGTSGSENVSSLFFLAALLLSWVNFSFIVLESSSTYFPLYSWAEFGVKDIYFSITNDNLTAIMLVVVLSISTLVHYYSRSYMEGDPHLSRFLSYLSFFTFLMLILVSSSNLIQLFVGWEGVGLCSYLLVSYWNSRNSAVKSALKAILVNRFGDLGFILATILLWNIVGSICFQDMANYFSNNHEGCFLISLFLIVAVTGKSAQFGLHSWLPDAMEGPTPVSALIHAATMVTAGIFLVIRCSFIFSSSKTSLLIILILGSITAVFAASVGLVQNDFKKVIAYSTCSQLGYMALVCGLGEFSLSLFHLFNHAFFKALLFLSAGSIIHALMDEQDFRKGSLLNLSSPIAFICTIVGSLSLMGLPFLTGFYSKDTIIELSNVSTVLSSAYWLGLLAACFTAFYSFRLIVAGMIHKRKGSFITERLSTESGIELNISIVVLSIFSIVIGFLSINFFKTDSIPMINSFSKQLPLLFSLAGALTISLVYFIISSKQFLIPSNPGIMSFKSSRLSFFNSITSYLRSAWSYDFIVHYFFSRPVLDLGEFFYHKIDRQMIEMVGPWRISEVLIDWTTKMTFYHGGLIYNYISFLTIFLILIVIS